jgi:hypothetical protein
MGLLGVKGKKGEKMDWSQSPSRCKGKEEIESGAAVYLPWVVCESEERAASGVMDGPREQTHSLDPRSS